jgi:hypothetical protein
MHTATCHSRRELRKFETLFRGKHLPNNGIKFNSMPRKICNISNINYTGCPQYHWLVIKPGKSQFKQKQHPIVQ